MSFNGFMGGLIGGLELGKRAIEMRPAQIMNLKPKHNKRPTVYSVGGIIGLQMQVQPSGAKSWLLRIRVGGKRREIGLGPYPDVTVAMARDKARQMREQIAAGIDPVAERRAAQAILIEQRAKSITFAEAMQSYLSGKLHEFSNEKHRNQWRSTLTTYALPVIGNKPVNDIAVQDVQRVLDPIWLTKTETATRVRGRVESVLAWATVHGYREGDNPARWKGNLDAVMPKPGKVAKTGNHPAVAIADLPGWFAMLRTREGMAARALEFLTLCASRSGEVRGMEWGEVDLEARMWTIPAERMKAGKEHRVPLTDAAVAILEGIERRDDSPYVFAAQRGGMLSDMSISAVMRRMPGEWLDPRSGRPAVPHGLRSTFRDWVAETTDYPREIAEMALAHQVGNEVERAYRRGDMAEKRRALMTEWADYCLSCATH